MVGRSHGAETVAVEHPTWSGKHDIHASASATASRQFTCTYTLTADAKHAKRSSAASASSVSASIASGEAEAEAEAEAWTAQRRPPPVPFYEYKLAASGLSTGAQHLEPGVQPSHLHTLKIALATSLARATSSNLRTSREPLALHLSSNLALDSASANCFRAWV